MAHPNLDTSVNTCEHLWCALDSTELPRAPSPHPGPLPREVKQKPGF